MTQHCCTEHTHPTMQTNTCHAQYEAHSSTAMAAVIRKQHTSHNVNSNITRQMRVVLIGWIVDVHAEIKVRTTCTRLRREFFVLMAC